MQLSVFKADSIYSALAQSVEHAAVNRSVVGSSPTSGAIPVIMATRIHLFPFRTQKLSSSTAKVLDHPRSGRIASCRISKKAQSQPMLWLRSFFATCYPTREDEGGFLKTVDTYCFAARDEQTHMSRVCGARARRCPYALRESKLPRCRKLCFEQCALWHIAMSLRCVSQTAY